ncbi:COR domain-containing protein [Vibrio parahaemolyticus]|uniref:COR domain-containing protein n=1 Tax=Vibrio parahaemolyticus TaxID=670 RepID=UPI001D164562|nr:COR domain-containing protein [Vibrio parahaemolyticus]MCC3834817.1 GTP-binding protein [Vibrio parahaemolyticus]
MINPINELKDWLVENINSKVKIVSSAQENDYMSTLLVVQNDKLTKILNCERSIIKSKHKELLAKIQELKLLDNLVHLDVTLDQETIHIVNFTKNLEHLITSYYHDSSIYNELDNLTSIELHINSRTPKPFIVPPKVVDLTIHFNEYFEDSDFKISKANNLHTLSYYGKFSDSMLSQVKEMKNLTSISMISHLTSQREPYSIKGNYDFRENEKLKSLMIYEAQGFTFANNDPKNSSTPKNLYLNDEITDITALGLDIKSHNISSLKKLKNLNLSRSAVEETVLIEALKLGSVETIYLTDTHIDTTEIGENKSIKKLVLNDCGIKHLDFVNKLKNIELLDVDSNPIEQIPNKIPESLTEISASECKIINIPKEIALSFEINISPDNSLALQERIINLRNNPLQNPPLELIEQGRDAITEYYSSMTGETTTLNEAKVVFVGDGAAGKTSLMKRLVSNDFNEKESQTDGIEIMNYRVSLENECCINAAIWDFGGQQILQATHQLFLSKRSIYVLVVEDRKNDLHKDQDIEQWLTQINSLGGRPPIIVVKNKIDENPHGDIQTNRLKTKFPNIVAFHEISCLTGDGLKRLSTTLNRCIVDLPMRRLELPQNWLNVKNELKSQARTHDLLHLNTYQEICSKHNINNKVAKDTLLRLLHDLGEVIAFEELKKHNTAILEPSWITEGIYGLIRSRPLADNNGIISLKEAQLALDKYSDIPGRFEDKASYILDAMETFQLCHRTMESETYLIPILLPPQIDTSSIDLEFANKDTIRFMFKFEKFLPPNLMPMLLVKIHEWIHGDKRWRTGAILTPTHLKAQAKLELGKVERELHIQISGDEKRDLFINLRSTINELIDKLANKKAIGLQELIPLNDSGSAVGYTELIGLKSMGESRYISGKLGQAFNISELLGEIEPPQDTKRAIQTLLESAPNGMINIMNNENTNTITGGNVTTTVTTTQDQVADVTAAATSSIDIKQELRAFKGQSEFVIEDIEEAIEELTDSDRKLKEFATKECSKVSQAIEILEAKVEDKESADNNLKHFSRVQNFLEGALTKANSVGKVIDQAGNLYNQVESLATKYNELAAKFAMPVVTVLGLGS